jgi:hypothetical protein
MRIRHTLFALLSALALSAGAVHAAETIDRNTPPTVRNNMHACPWGSIVTGVDVAQNWLLCMGDFRGEVFDERVVSGALWPPDQVTRVAHNYTGAAIPWCGPGRFVTGVHAANRSFSCAQFNYTPWRLNHVVVDGGTMRSAMHACPRGQVLVGANFDTNTFLCAGNPICHEVSHCPSASDVCDGGTSLAAGHCRRQGLVHLKEDNGCFQDTVGTVSDRSGVTLDFTLSNSYIDNDEARSLQFANVKAGAILRLYDSPSGDTSDDWTQIFVKNDTSRCLGTLQGSANDATWKVDHHHVNGLDGKVSRLDVRSAILDYAGRCLDIATGNNSAQVFGCHAGPNQSWSYQWNGEIRLLHGNLCLEANSAEIHTWPALPAGQTRRAAVRAANCNGSDFQKWTVTEAGEIRMFSGMCLDIQGGTSVDQAQVQLYPCHGGQNQRWRSTF